MNTISDKKVLVAIPCFNEARFISDIVLQVKKYVPDVLVVDDGSTDGTADVAAKAGAILARHNRNMGAGAATWTALREARARKVDVLVSLDGDGQHAPEDLPSVLAPALEGSADIIIGSRFLNQGYRAPAYRKFGIDVITWLFNIGARMKIGDSQSCFRAYSRKAIESLSISEQRFAFSVELLIQARRLHLKIAEVPISCIYHSNGSSMNPIRHGLDVALAVVRLRIKQSLLKRKNERNSLSM